MNNIFNARIMCNSMLLYMSYIVKLFWRKYYPNETLVLKFAYVEDQDILTKINLKWYWSEQNCPEDPPSSNTKLISGLLCSVSNKKQF